MSDKCRVITRAIGVVAAAVATCGLLLPASAVAQQATAQSSTAPAQVSEQDNWRRAMAKTPLPGKGCFTTSYPDTEWHQSQCVTAPPRPPTPPSARMRLPKADSAGADVGDGDDYTAVVASGTSISEGEGAFDAVSGVTSENDGGLANQFSLQLNANTFPTASGSCDTITHCTGWAQFVYANPYYSATGAQTYAAAFIQYWLLNYGPTCPSGWSPSPSSYPSTVSCYYNSLPAQVPLQGIASLSSMTLTGTTSSGGDTVIFSLGGTLYRTSNSGIGLGGNWSTAEFNVLGDGGGSAATFNSGGTLAVRTSIDNGTTNAPTCQQSGTTGETNSLTLITTCCPFAVKGGAGSPGIVFLESSASPLPTPNCSALTNISPLASNYDPIANTLEVYYLGGDLNVHELYYTGISWGTGDPTSAAGAPVAAINSPLVSGHDPIANTQEVYFLGSDQHVHELYYTGTSWGTQDATAVAGAPAAVSGSPMVSDYDSIVNAVEVYYVASDLHIHELYYSGAAWQTRDVTAAAGAVAIAPSTSLSSDYDPITKTQEVYYIGSDLHVHELYYTGTSWGTGDPTAASSAPSAMSGSPLSSAYDPLAKTLEVYYLGSDLHVYALYYTGTSWGAADLTAASSGDTATPGSPLISDYDAFANVQEVYYLGADLRVHELYYNGSSWGATGPAATAGAPAAAPGSTLFGGHDPIANTQEIYYLGSDLNVHELYYNGASWGTTNPTATAGAPPAE